MLPRNIFYDRRDNYCTKCEFWKGSCRKGHSLSSPQGCPIKKFPPIEGASYAPDLPAREVSNAVDSTNCCGRTDPDLTPMTWKEAADHLSASLVEWARTGFPITSDEVYAERVVTCQDDCRNYRWFQCRLCKCLIFTKARVPSEKCPAEKWKR
jgi:hypothetical protein